ncbi:MAG TPA: helix-turn-helix-type transcriptional regulator [Bacteroidales bacterium]|jgi:DNA-binding transcriptional MerR regulator|nr:helix-turn-helix-type transcriptional regulator [Bacteroidales bacterium]
MASYSIKELENLSGIKAHTIRIWEKRYGVIKPARTDTNIRFYCDSELKRLLNIAILNRYGMRISDISKLSDIELSEKVINASSDSSNAESNIENLIIAMVEMDEYKFDRILSRFIMHVGFENTVIKVIYPFFEKIGLLWQTGSINPAHEHFVSNLFRQKLMVAIDNIVIPENKAVKKFILFLPEGEYHELALLFYNYLIKKAGKLVYYLGSSVPFDDVVETSKMINPDFLFTSLTSSLNKDEIYGYINNLSKTFTFQKIFVTGMQIKENFTDLPSNVLKVSSPLGFVETLKDY